MTPSLGPAPRATRASDDALALTARPAMTPPPAHLNILRTLSGRWLLLSAALFVVLLVLRIFIPTLPLLLEIFKKVVSLSLIASAITVVTLGIRRNRRRLLWRVRRKLILSYLLLGLVPIVLVTAFILAGGVMLYTNVAAYLFQEGFSDLEEEIHQIATTAASEIDRLPASPQVTLDRKYANATDRYPELSLIVLTDAATSAEVAKAGSWTHVTPPDHVPGWLKVAREFKGVVAIAPPGSEAEPDLVIRVAAMTADRSKTVIVDLPVDTDIIARLADKLGTRMRGASRVIDPTQKNQAAVLRASAAVVPPRQAPPPGAPGLAFRQTVVSMDFTDWNTGATGTVTIGLDAPADRLYRRMEDLAHLPTRWGSGLLVLFIALTILFLIIQGSALIIGGILARSITSAVHELFVGTERVQQGDFAHRIKIETRDQLGDLADSFNRMSASIEHLLHVQREKQRLDDELRIARDIQKSLLPTVVPTLRGLSIAELCEPAREVGGDYYDFFELGGGHLGVLIADVSGKGTSAALYMAELKGIMLALSHSERSPRRLLMNVNHMLAEHLDNRSFITMTYAVIDLQSRTLTCARAGHTPLIVVTSRGSEVLIPNGMVLGLRLPGAGERFDSLLEEHTVTIGDGDVIVLYTDGITEAMDGRGELFGDSTLADVITAHRDLDARQIREGVLAAVRSFVGDAEPHDDMTMVVLKFDHAAEAVA